MKKKKARVTRRGFSHLYIFPYIFPYRGELLRVALLIQLCPSPSSRTSSTLLVLLSSPRCSGLVTCCLSSRVRWAGDGGSGTAGQRDHHRGTYGTDLGLRAAWGETHEHRGGGFREGPRDSGTQYAQRTGETVSG
ncbi:hypothetical protein DPMN_167989 [Dreissena polymorpha]|uniref:Uncharacterized protein n=1 Tax=Dreissena polymorpha TaxID=45954 RepID=A0A9D4IVI3_DREPO|nr:hypothetical protein DPMN_167989 [Dreissena polymorpha]